MKKMSLILLVLLSSIGIVAHSQNTTPAAVQKTPLTRSQIEQMLDNKSEDVVIAGEIKARCINFKVDAKVLAALGNKGAGERTTQALLELMNKPCPEPTLPSTSDTKPGALPPAPPDADVMAAVRQALSKMDTSYSSADTNSRSVFVDLSQKWQEKAASGLITIVSQPGDSVVHWRAAKLMEYYLRDPNAQKLRDDMLNALSTGIGIESSSYTQRLYIQIIRESPTTNEGKFQRLEGYLKTLQDSETKSYLIVMLGELALPKQREGLAMELTRQLTITQDINVASAATGVIVQYKYRQAIPDLIKALQSAPPFRGGYSSVAGYIAGLLRDLTPPNDPQGREQLAALMTDLMMRTMDPPFASVAANIITESNYRKAAPSMTQLLCTTNNNSIGSSAAEIIKGLKYREALPALREALQTSTMEIAVHISGLLAHFQDKEGVSALRTRIENDTFTSHSGLVTLGRTLFELQGEQATDLLIECFKGNSNEYIKSVWIDFFREKRISKAREAVQSYRDSTTNSYYKQKADEYLKSVQ
jgi:HEAT repeat protein